MRLRNLLCKSTTVPFFWHMTLQKWSDNMQMDFCLIFSIILGHSDHPTF